MWVRGFRWHGKREDGRVDAEAAAIGSAFDAFFAEVRLQIAMRAKRDAALLALRDLAELSQELGLYDDERSGR